jgi:hypothetical protein
MRWGLPRIVLFAVLTAVLGASGCGGSGHAKSAPTSTSAQSGASAALSARNLIVGDFPGFQLGAPDIAEGAGQWVLTEMFPAGQVASEKAALQRLGFVGGLSQHLTATDGSNHEGLLVVEQFGSPAAARTEVTRQYAEQTKPMPGGHLTTFAVPAVPGARAYKGTTAQFGGYNVLWADGRYYYLVGAGWPGSDPHPPSRALVVTAAQHVYQRDHGLPGG